MLDKKTMRRRTFLLGAAVVLSVGMLMAPVVATAHHGWRWAEDGQFEVTGTITKAALGNPHGVLTLDVNGEAWIVEVGQPWRNERAGLTDAMLAPGTDVTIQGHRSKDPAERKVKAERVIVDGKVHNLYPDRQ